jgi:hypothetical protein
MKHSMVRSALAFAVLTASFGLSACHDGHPDREDHRHGEHHDDGGHDTQHRDQPHD